MPTCVLSEIESYCSSTRILSAISLHTSHSVSGGPSLHILSLCIIEELNRFKDLSTVKLLWTHSNTATRGAPTARKRTQKEGLSWNSNSSKPKGSEDQKFEKLVAPVSQSGALVGSGRLWRTCSSPTSQGAGPGGHARLYTWITLWSFFWPSFSSQFTWSGRNFSMLLTANFQSDCQNESKNEKPLQQLSIWNWQKIFILQN